MQRGHMDWTKNKINKLKKQNKKERKKGPSRDFSLKG